MEKNDLTYAQNLRVIDDIYRTRGIIGVCIKNQKKRIKDINRLLSEIQQGTDSENFNVFNQQLLQQKQSGQKKLVTWFAVDYFLTKELAISKIKVSQTDYYNFSIRYLPVWREPLFKFTPLTFNPSVGYQTMGLTQLSTLQAILLSLLFVVSISGSWLCYVVGHQKKYVASGPPSRWGWWSLGMLLPMIIVTALAKNHYANTALSVGLVDILFAGGMAAFVFLLVYWDASIEKNRRLFPRLPRLYTWTLLFFTFVYNWSLIPALYSSNTTPLILLTMRQFALLVVGIKFIVLLVSRQRDTSHETFVCMITKRLAYFSGCFFLFYAALVSFNHQWPAEQYFVVFKTIGLTLFVVGLVAIVMPLWGMIFERNHAMLKIAKGLWYLFGAINLGLLYNGYHRLALFLIPNLLVMFGLFLILRDIYHIVSDAYKKLLTPSSSWNKKAYALLGTNPKGVFELVVAKYSLMIPGIYLSMLTFMELWGTPIYKLQDFAFSIQHGFLILDKNINFVRLIRATFLTLLGVLLARMVATLILRKIKFTGESAHTRQLARVLIIGLFLILSIILGLIIAGIDVTSIVVFSGAISIGLGFGLQSFARDLVGGFTLMSNQSIKIGEYIQVMERGKLVGEGVVEKITFLSTTLSLNGVKSYLPNSKLTSEAVIDFEKSYFKQISLCLLFEHASLAIGAFDTIKEQIKTQPGLLLQRPYQPVLSRVDNQLVLVGRLKEGEDEEQVLTLWEKNLQAWAKKKKLKYKITRTQ